MRSCERMLTTLLPVFVLLVIVPSAISFTSLTPGNQRFRDVRLGIISESHKSSTITNELSTDLNTTQDGQSTTSMLEKENDDAIITASTSTSTSYYYDPSDAFTGESPTHSDIMIDDLLKENKSKSDSKQAQTTAAADIIRDLDGNPLSKNYFAHKLGIDTREVQYYTCLEKEAFRGLNGDACRVHLFPGGQTLFYKRIVFEEMDHALEKLKTAPHKLLRDIKSHQVVASFLLSKACQELTEKTGVHIPKCYDAQLEPNHSNPMESKFSFLLEDLAPSNGWYQQWLLQDIEECQAALSTYAKIHAFFWNGSTFWRKNNDNNENGEDDNAACRELETGVWESGSYVQPKVQNVNQCKIVAKEWTTKRLKFEKELSSLDCWDNLGERLESVAEQCGRLAHPFADDDVDTNLLSEQYKKYRTFTHGDPKHSNLLFRRSTKTGESSNKLLQVGLIDFQWSGFGLAATDIAHFLTSSVHADMLVDGGENILLKYYFDELQKYLVEYGACNTADDALLHFSFDTFTDQYETGVLDICRLMIAYTWSRFTESVDKDDKAACHRTMNKTSYNKSIPNVVWLITRCDEIMKSRGV